MRNFRDVFIAFTLLLLTNMFSISVKAQGVNVFVKDESVAIENLATGKNSTATKYYFSDTIADFMFDDSSDNIIFQFKNRGKQDPRDKRGSVGSIDLGNRKANWLFTYGENAELLWQYDSCFFILNDEIDRYVTTVINKKDGSRKFKWNLFLNYWNPEEQIAIAAKLEDEKSAGKIKGIDIRTGKTKWSRKMRFDYGLQDYIELNDTTLLFTAKGLYTVNVKTGKGWHYDTRIAIRNYEPIGSDRNIHLLDQLLSNLIIEKDGLFFASAENISFLSYDGTLDWAQKFPPKTASSSQLFISDTLVYMVNRGVGYIQERTVSYGKPFIAVYNRNNGQQLFYQIIEQGKFVKKATVLDNKLYIITDKSLLAFNLPELKCIYQRAVDSTFSCANFSGDSVYISTDLEYLALDTLYGSSIVVLDKSGNALVLSSDLKTIATIEKEKLFYWYDKYNGYTLLGNQNESVLTVGSKKALNIKLSSLAFFNKNNICDIKQNELLVCPIDR